MHNNSKNLLLTATLLVSGPLFGQANPAPSANPAANPGMSPSTGPATNQPVRQQPRPTPGLKPCESVTVDPLTYLALGKSRVIKLPFPAARLLLGGQSSSRAGQPTNVGASGAPPAPVPAPALTGPAAFNGVADLEITLLSPTELFFLSSVRLNQSGFM